MMYTLKKVEKTPKELEEGVVYLNVEYELATLKCACGCGHKVVLLYPDGHSVIDDGGYATIYPSVGVWDAPCRSHFFVTQGQVEWCNSWSDEKIKHFMNAQRTRHDQEGRQPWWVRMVNLIRGFFFR